MEKQLLRMDEVMTMIPYRKSKIRMLIKEGELETRCPNGVGKKPTFIVRRSVERYLERIKRISKR